MTAINVEAFNDTPVIQKLKQSEPFAAQSTATEYEVSPACSSNAEKTKSTRGRKRKYNTEEERIQARRAQQKAYRERKKKEFEELKAMAMRVASSDSQ